MIHVLGIDIGGTKISAVVTDQDGTKKLHRMVSTKGYLGKDHVLKTLKVLIQEIKNEFSAEIKAIGVGTPGYVDARLGKVIYSCGIIKDWVEVALAQELGQLFQLPIAVENDANAAAIGEGWLGAAQDMDQYMVITLGTSLGGAYVNGSGGVLHGYGWRGGEIGHSILYPNGKECRCGQRGCAELYLSGTAIVNRFRELGGISANCEDVFRAMEQKDAKALEVREEFVDDLAVLLISLQNILDPQAFIISGGLIHTKKHWWDNLQQLLSSKSNSGVNINVLPAQLLNLAGSLGAARIALNLVEHNHESLS